MNKININQYLDSTYLKTAIQAGISEEETKKNVQQLVAEAIENNFKLVMIRPEYVSMAREMISKSDSSVLIGTVIGFHEGTNSTAEKLKQAAQLAINQDWSSIKPIREKAGLTKDDLISLIQAPEDSSIWEKAAFKAARGAISFKDFRNGGKFDPFEKYRKKDYTLFFFVLVERKLTAKTVWMNRVSTWQ